ncbi:leucine-rich repeat-containing protein 56 isoform X6 [Odocoileus virginianus]|uniref:Leucine-rich repeat-containing protein 56 isoform X6 n=1 Tax=Odocoileus virginianus TaxID=9874 RepID=A0ABM4HER6_ODOVR
MDQAWDGACGPWPSTARVQVRELSPQSLHNPQPRSKAPGHCEHGHSGQLAEECLSPTRLQALAQEDDLQLVSMLEMCVNTRENSLGSFGLHLPNLSQLKLNGSCLGSLRDLGTSLGHLHVLWLARCGLADLDGISSFPALKELYLSYNDIWDLSPLCLLEHLEVLDLEGNCVEDLGQLRYLQLCPRLATLTLEGNPLCLRPGPGPTHQVTRLSVKLALKPLSPKPGPAAPSSPGTGRVLCGNPTKGLQERRHQCQAGVHPEKLPPPRLEELAPRASAPRPDPADDRDLLACAGLQALRELHLQWVPPTPHPSPATLCALIRGGLWLGPALAELLLVPGWLEGRVTGAQGWGTSPKSHSSGICSKEGAGCSLPQPHPSPLPSRCPESWEEGAAAPWGPQKGPEEQEDKAGPKPHRSPPSLAPESSRTSGYNLIPCPPKSSMPDRGCSSRGSADLQFRGRRLRTLGSLEPGLGQRLAPVTALRAREVTSGPSPQAEGCPGPKPAPDSAARPPASGACRT